jgi:hypothetical protein
MPVAATQNPGTAEEQEEREEEEKQTQKMDS